MTDTCRACHVPILWTKTETGKSMPMDVKPEKRFIIEVYAGGDDWQVEDLKDVDARPERYRVAPATDPQLRVRTILTYVSHFATCPSVDRFRKG